MLSIFKNFRGAIYKIYMKQEIYEEGFWKFWEGHGATNPPASGRLIPIYSNANEYVVSVLLFA